MDFYKKNSKFKLSEKNVFNDCSEQNQTGILVKYIEKNVDNKRPEDQTYNTNYGHETDPVKHLANQDYSGIKNGTNDAQINFICHINTIDETDRRSNKDPIKDNGNNSRVHILHNQN